MCNRYSQYIVNISVIRRKLPYPRASHLSNLGCIPFTCQQAHLYKSERCFSFASFICENYTLTIHVSTSSFAPMVSHIILYKLERCFSFAFFICENYTLNIQVSTSSFAPMVSHIIRDMFFICEYASCLSLTL